MKNPPKKSTKKLTNIDHDKEIQEINDSVVSLSDKQIANAIAGLEKQYGRGIVMRLGDEQSVSKTVDLNQVIPTGLISLDKALGIGGLPRGRIIEIAGPESSGKSTFCLHIIAQAQKLGGVCLYIDAEHALDRKYSEVLGVNLNELLLNQPDYGEQGLDVAEHFMKNTNVSCIVIDSVAALTPKVELEGDIGDIHVGLQARLMSQAMRKLTSLTHKTNTCVIFINQFRQKIGITYGRSDVTTGGNALKFYASIRMEIRTIGTVRLGGESTEAVGSRALIKVIKNKMAPPYKSAEFDIIYGKGISFEGDLLDQAVLYGVVDKGGAWYSYEDIKLGQGRLAAIQSIKDEPKLANELREKIKEAST